MKNAVLSPGVFRNEKKPHMDDSNKKNISKFLALVFLFSLPFWLAGMAVERLFPSDIPVNLPFSAMMFFCPTAAALVLSAGENGREGVIHLFKRSLDISLINNWRWLLVAVLLWPLIMLVSYFVLPWFGMPQPALSLPGWLVFLSFAAFLFAALGEEIGWMGYAIGPLQQCFGALNAALLLGVVRILWHILPFIQTGNTASWIIWQCFCLLVMHVLTVWLYNCTGRSVLAAAMFHAMYNVVTLVFPNYGFLYIPSLAGWLTALVALVIVYLWSPRTLCSFRWQYEN